LAQLLRGDLAEKVGISELDTWRSAL